MYIQTEVTVLSLFQVEREWMIDDVQTLLLVNDDAGVHKMRHFCCHPWCEPETERMRDAEARRVFGPQRLEMDGEADFATTVHFGGSV